MPAEDKQYQSDYIYVKNFENYLKPKSDFKSEPLQDFSKTISIFKAIESMYSEYWQRFQELQLPNFLNFLKARNDDGLCKRKTGFEIYCELASIHGFYIFVGAKTWQRILWWCVMCLAVLLSVIVVTMSLANNRNRPTVRLIESVLMPTTEMPFPSVTICNMNRISKRSLLKKSRQLNITEDTLRKIHWLSSSRTEAFDLPTITNLNWSDLLDELSPRICEQIVNCKWEGSSGKCHPLLHSVRTMELRYCCTFNNDGKLYTSHYGSTMGLNLQLDPQIEDYGNVNFASSGFEIIIHESQTIVNEATQRIYVPSGSETHLMIKVVGTRSAFQLASLSLDKRRCYLTDERQLFYFAVYSQTNCIAECHSERLLELCGCLPPYLPHPTDRPVCQLEQMKCLQLHDLGGEIVDKESGKYLCDCLPSCNIHRYEIQSDVRLMNPQVIDYHHLNNSRDFNSSDKVLVRVYYDSPIAMQLRLDVFENWLTFIGNIGGITGLFMGCSFVSVFELIFFTCIRPTCNWLTRQQIRYRLQLKARTQVGSLVQPN